MKIYVGNLSYDVTESELQTAFAAFGKVETVTIMIDKYTGRSKGFAFIEMPSQEEAQAAITGLNGKELKGRNLNVNEARPRTEHRDSGGYGGSGRDRGGYGGGGRDSRGGRSSGGGAGRGGRRR